jgi:hypothetical protein
VEIVRPTSGPLADCITGVCLFLLRALFVMLAVGALYPAAHLGYGKALLVTMLVSSLWQSDYTLWTRAGSKK